MRVWVRLPYDMATLLLNGPTALTFIYMGKDLHIRLSDIIDRKDKPECRPKCDSVSSSPPNYKFPREMKGCAPRRCFDAPDVSGVWNRQPRMSFARVFYTLATMCVKRHHNERLAPPPSGEHKNLHSQGK